MAETPDPVSETEEPQAAPLADLDDDEPGLPDPDADAEGVGLDELAAEGQEGDE